MFFTETVQIVLRNLLDPLDMHPRVISSRVRLNSALSLVILLIILISRLFNENQSPYYLILVIAAYLIGRTRYYEVGGAFLLIVLTAPAYLNIYFATEQYTRETIFFPLSWLLIPLILTSLLYSFRGFFSYAITEAILLLSLPYWVPGVTYNMLFGTYGLFFSTVMLLFFSIQQREREESQRQKILQDSNRQLEVALNSARMGVWTWDITTGKVSWSNEIEPIFGMRKGEFGGDFESYKKLIHPDDLDYCLNKINDAVQYPDQEYAVFHRIIWPDSSIHWLEGRGQVLTDSQGKAVSMIGTVVDVTQRKLAEEAMAKLTMESKEALLREQKMSDLGRTIGTALELPVILQTVLKLTVELLKADAGTLNIFSHDGEKITDIYDYNLPDPVAGTPLPKNTGVVWEIYRKREAVYLENYSKHPSALRVISDAGFKEMLGIPLMRGEECLGVLAVLSAAPELRFFNDDLQLLEVIGKQAAVAIDNARLYESAKKEIVERQNTEAVLIERDQVLQSITYAAEQFLSAPNWREKINVVLERLGQVTGATHAYLFENFSENGIQYGRALYEWTREGFENDLVNADYQNMPLLEEGFEIWYETLSAKKVFQLGFNQLDQQDYFAERGIKSILDVPIFTQDVWWGTIGFDDYEEARVWPSAVEDALKIAAQVISAAVEREQADLALREQENQYRLELERRVLQRTEELELALDELEKFSYTVSHDLRAPLRGINGLSQIVEKDFNDQIPQQVREYVQRISETASGMGKQVDNLLTFSRLGRQVLRKVNVNTNSLVQGLVEDFIQELPGINLQIHFKDLPDAYADPLLLKQVWVNLLDNAIKFSSGKDPLRIDISAERKGSQVSYSIRDYGAGFDMRYANKLFGIFQRLHREDEFEGIGVGLAIAQRIIQRHNGEIHADSVLGEGATFTFNLPLREK